MSQGTNQPATPTAAIRTMQIIAGALVVGVVTFLVIAVVAMRSGSIVNDNPWAVGDPMVLAVLALGASAIPASFVLPDMLTRPAAVKSITKPSDASLNPQWKEWGPGAQPAMVLYQTRTIIRGALLEGAAFFSVIVYSLSGSGIALILAITLVALLATNIPTADRVFGWIESVRSEANPNG